MPPSIQGGISIVFTVTTPGQDDATVSVRNIPTPVINQVQKQMGRPEIAAQLRQTPVAPIPLQHIIASGEEYGDLEAERAMDRITSHAYELVQEEVRLKNKFGRAAWKMPSTPDFDTHSWVDQDDTGLGRIISMDLGVQGDTWQRFDMDRDLALVVHPEEQENGTKRSTLYIVTNYNRDRAIIPGSAPLNPDTPDSLEILPLLLPRELDPGEIGREAIQRQIISVEGADNPNKLVIYIPNKDGLGAHLVTGQSAGRDVVEPGGNG